MSILERPTLKNWIHVDAPIDRVMSALPSSLNNQSKWRVKVNKTQKIFKLNAIRNDKSFRLSTLFNEVYGTVIPRGNSAQIELSVPIQGFKLKDVYKVLAWLVIGGLLVILGYKIGAFILLTGLFYLFGLITFFPIMVFRQLKYKQMEKKIGSLIWEYCMNTSSPL